MRKDIDRNSFGLVTKVDGPSGNSFIFIADTENHRILQYYLNKRFQLKTIARISKQAGSRSNQLDKPKKVRLDTHGNLFVLDSNNRRVQKFSIINSSTYVHPSRPNSPDTLRNRIHLLYLKSLHSSSNSKVCGGIDKPNERGRVVSDTIYPQPIFEEAQRPARYNIHRHSHMTFVHSVPQRISGYDPRVARTRFRSKFKIGPKG
ncbi:unnamed protein product [Adineta ricciae]|nr:unnamed protein product [Adineta ricciae]